MKNVYGKDIKDNTRLTRHYQDWEVELAKPNKDYITTDYFCPKRDVSYDDCLNKLGPLEDIEEEFKVSLIQVANKKCEVWFKKEIIEYDNGGNWYKELGKQTIIHNSIITAIDFDKKRLYIKGAKMWVYANDYGKTWALKKEELE